MNINKNKRESVSQKEQILGHMQKGHVITAIEALNKFGCFRLSARIKDLRDEKYNIKAKTVNRNGKMFAGYYLGEDSDRTETQTDMFD
jgi:hypothetical protein